MAIVSPRHEAQVHVLVGGNGVRQPVFSLLVEGPALDDKHRQVERYDPGRTAAYNAGRELSRLMRGRDPMAGGEVSPFDAMNQMFAGTFDSGQTKKVQETKREVHFISETEYILTETQREVEVFSFGTGIFDTDNNRRKR